MAVLFNDLLPSLGQFHNTAFIKLSIFLCEKLVKVLFDEVFRSKRFTIQRVLQREINESLMQGLGYMVDVATLANQAETIFAE